MTSDRFVERWIVDAPGQVDDIGAGLERGDRDLGVVRLRRDQDPLGGHCPDDRQEGGQLAIDADLLGVLAGGLCAHIDHRSPFDGHPAGAIESGLGVVGDALAVGGLAREVDHAELIGPVIEHAADARELEATDRMGEGIAVFVPQGQQIVGDDHVASSLVVGCCQSLVTRVRSPGSIGSAARRSLIERPRRGWTISGATSHTGTRTKRRRCWRG